MDSRGCAMRRCDYNRYPILIATLPPSHYGLSGFSAHADVTVYRVSCAVWFRYFLLDGERRCVKYIPALAGYVCSQFYRLFQR